MNNIKLLSFDSIHMLSLIRSIYLLVIKRLLCRKSNEISALILFRLDKKNIFLTNSRNHSGDQVGLNQEQMDALSIKFYRYLSNFDQAENIHVDGVSLYRLYPRQLKLKLEGVLRGALRLQRISDREADGLTVIADRQSIEIFLLAFKFLNISAKTLEFKENRLLTFLISFNSICMRSLIACYTLFSSSRFPFEYFYKHVSESAPTVLITTPKNRPGDFFDLYIKSFNKNFNIVLYCCGHLPVTPSGFERIDFSRSVRTLRGFFDGQTLLYSWESYITDILLIFKGHKDLLMSFDAVEALYSRKIDVHITRLQTNPVDLHIAIEARKRGCLLIGDMEEEIFDCDLALCPSELENTESLRMAVGRDNRVSYKGSNSMIGYRFQNFKAPANGYLHDALKVQEARKLIFYASAPSKEQGQRYLTEKLLMEWMLTVDNHVLVVKTHPQDDGIITHQAYIDAGSPFNVILVGDIKQAQNIASADFQILDGFDFNSAVASCDGFLTMSSSAILQALFLGVKSGVVDLFGNAFYSHLIEQKASMLVNNPEAFLAFLCSSENTISEDVLEYCGLKESNKCFDMGDYLLECLAEWQASGLTD